MVSIHFNSGLNDHDRRLRIFNGDIFVASLGPHTNALCAHASKIIENAFGMRISEAQYAQFKLGVEEFEINARAAQQQFGNHSSTNQLVRAILEDFGCPLEKTCQGIARLRLVTHGGYLTTGAGHAYVAHRDTWYASPLQQINWWMPVLDLEPERTLAFYPAHFNRAVSNSSVKYDYERDYGQLGRSGANRTAENVSRIHPQPLVPLDKSDELRVVVKAGEVLQFSSAHLHATVPNTSGLTRFSIDFRTINMDDLEQNRGAKNVDSLAKGSTLADFMTTADFSPLSTGLKKIC